MKNSASFSIFVTVLVLALFELWNYSLTSAEVFEKAWKQDFASLQKSRHLPPGFEDLKEIEVEAGDAAAKSLIAHAPAPIPVATTGRHVLQILVTTFATSNEWAAVIHYSLVDPVGNTVWELGRTLKFHSHTPEHVELLQEAAS